MNLDKILEQLTADQKKEYLKTSQDIASKRLDTLKNAKVSGDAEIERLKLIAADKEQIQNTQSSLQGSNKISGGGGSNSVSSTSSDILNQDIKTGVAAALLAAGIIVGAYKVYKRFFSAAAKSCSNAGSYKRKSLCMLQYELKAKQEEIRVLKSQISKCSNSKDPAKCKEKITERIAKLTYKISKLETKIERLKRTMASESRLLSDYLLYLTEQEKESQDEIDEQFDPISVGLIAAGVGATGAGLTAVKLAAQKRNRKKCIAYASQIGDKEERKKAYVRCYQAGQG